ncbi:MAG: InlB B-repeat-containing protein, partial [Clostridia bacterium]
MRKTVKVLLTVALAVLMVCTLVACNKTDTQQSGNNVNYTISFDSNGGSAVANMVVDGKSEITLPTTTKEGYFFAGWFVDNGTFNVRFNLAYITANPTKTSITVYAKWSVEEVVEQTYTVAFDSNGGSAVGNIVIAAGNTIKLPTAPTKTGYSFVGWFVDNNTFQIPFDLNYIKANPNNTAITLYAKWNAEHVNEKSMLTLAKNIDEAGTISGGGEKNCGLTVTVSATTNDGYVFDGWYDGSNKVSAEAVYQFTMPNDNLMLQAQWNKKAYTITLNSNGGQTLNPSTYEVFYTDNYNLPIPQREGFTFLGWYKNDVRYTNNRGASLQGWANLLNQTLKAMWEETIIEGSEFTVKYHLNYGNMEIVSRQTEQAKVSYFPERKGYTFNGWWLNSGIEGGEIVLATKWNNSDAVVHNHLVLYAEWIVESTSTIQLPAPVVSIVDGNKFVWDAITGAVGYEVVVKKDNTEVKKISITETMWQFQADLDAGNYSISFRAKGNGETNTNSQFTTKGYAHKVLPAVAEINFAEQNGYLNWTAVDIAEKYDLYINGKAVLKDTILTTFDMSFYDAGQHTVVVCAKKTGYLTSEATASFKKEHMSTPSGFKLVVDENATTTLSWDAVNHANQYRIYFKTLDSTPLIVSAPTYDILSSADCWTNATVNQKGEQTV